ncbi:uncharacterized protein JCM6883_002804 [Sporobolomyces salmoneus]|uniref:uncharacterized protein n=1 Tax=Sporobolomyces salmoneus TaxID=183962 RepID=UPI003170C904
MAASLTTPPPQVPVASFNQEDLLISITPWTTRTTSKAQRTPGSVSPSKRITRSSRNSLAVGGDENDRLQTSTTTTRKSRFHSGTKSRTTLLDAVTPSFKTTALSTPLVPLGLLRSALKKSAYDVSTPSQLQPKDSNSPSTTPIRTERILAAAIPTTTDDSTAVTPNRSPTKTLRFDEGVYEREAEKKKKKKRRHSGSSEIQDDEEEWTSDSDEEEGAERSHVSSSDSLHSAPSTPIPAVPSHLLPQTPSAYAFSPATPLVRAHESYDEDELTDCDADCSVYEEEASFAFTNVGRQLVQQQPRRLSHLSTSFSREDVEGTSEARESTSEIVELEENDRRLVFEDEDVVGETETSDIEAEATASDRPEGEEEVRNDLGTKFEEFEAPVQSQKVNSDEGEMEGKEADEELEVRLEYAEAKELEVPSIVDALPVSHESSLDDDDEEEGPADETQLPNSEQQSPILETPPSPFLAATPSSPVSSVPTLPLSSSPTTLIEPVPEAPKTPRKADLPISASQRTPVVFKSTPAAQPSTEPRPFRPTQPQIHDAPTARRQLTKLTSLASKRSHDDIRNLKEKSVLTAIVPGSAASEGRRGLTMSKPSSLPPVRVQSSVNAVPKPPPSVSRLVAPSAVRPRTNSNASTSQLPTVNENPKSTKLSSSLPASTSMKPPSSTIPRPRSLLPRSGLKPPSASVKSTSRTGVGSSTSARPAPPPSKSQPPQSTAKTSRPIPSSTVSRPVPPPVRSARPDLPLPSPAPRQLPPLQQTSSAPSVLTSSRGPTPPLQQSKASQLPPVPRSARPANHTRPLPPVAPSTASAPARATSSPQKRPPIQPHSDVSLLSNVCTIPVAAESSIERVPTQAAPPSTISSPLPASPVNEPRHIDLSSPSVERTRSPRRAIAASPLRSPRRVPLSQPPPPAFPPTTQQTPSSTMLPPSALVLPADKLVATSSSAPSDVFGSAPPQSAPVRSSRIRSARPIDENVAVVPEPLPQRRLTRRTAAASSSLSATTNDLPSGPPPPRAAPKSSAPLVPRSARRPPKPTPIPDPTDESVDDSTSPSASEPDLPVPLSLPSAALFLFNPAPALTQEELSRLTQRNTKKNQQNFNKIKIETVYLEENRPPSPTSKIRKSFGADNSSTGGGGGAMSKEASKESREARAAKRRRALRSSTDGSELETLQAELGQGDGDSLESLKIEPMLHFRAAGDEEQFCSPARPVKKSGGKKKSSVSTSGGKKQVKWDKALVYEGPRQDALSDLANGILKHVSLDIWGNSTDTSTSFAKPAPVVIRKRVFKDDEQ